MLSPVRDEHHCEKCSCFPLCTIDEINPAWRSPINSAVKQHHYLKKNEVLYLPQNTFHHIYAVQEGSLKTYQLDSDGHELIRGFYFTGEVLGLEGIYSKHYLFSAVALTDSVICEIPYDNFLELLQANASLQKHMLNIMSQQLNMGSYLISHTAEKRLAAFLIDLSCRLEPGKILSCFELSMSRQDIGNYLQLTAETISRIFSNFKKNKLIKIHQRSIELLQPQKLQLIADIL
jgi:CRP/FNR family transcriptional regulator, anaerobic regulatory protein